MILFLILGMGVNGLEIIIAIYLSEISAKNFRNYSIIVLNLFWAISQIYFPFFYNFVNSWRLFIFFFNGFPLFLFWILNEQYLIETPIYYYWKKKYQNTKDVLNHIAKKNKRPIFDYKLGKKFIKCLFIFYRESQIGKYLIY